MISPRQEYGMCSGRRPPSDGLRSGYTLVELVASLAATSILLAGMGSVVYVAARSTDESTMPAMRIQTSAASHDVLSDLQYAVSFQERSTAAVQFKVADRDGDGSPDTIRYAWSGTPGDPLTRQYNSRTAANYLENVHVFEYADHVETVQAFDGTQKHCVYQSDISLQIGDDASSRIVGLVKTHNAPEVPAP